MQKQQPIKVSLLATPDTTPSTLFGLHDVLSSVGVGWETFVTGDPAEPRFDVSIVSTTGKPVSCGSNVLVTPHASTEEIENADIALIASWIPNDGASVRNCDKRELEWLFRLKDQSSTLASMCTSTVLLAEAGILDGKEATTFWAYRDIVRVRYPRVQWRIDRTLCVAGDDKQIVTAGSATVWQDLALYLISRFCSAEQAVNAAKLWVIPDRDGKQSAFSAKSLGVPHDDSVVHACQLWIEENYSTSNPIAEMVNHAGIPASTFARRFKNATGDKPMDYVHMLRIEKAKELLEKGFDTVDEIGSASGYEDPASFRRIFKRKVGLTPSVYRRRFNHSRYDQITLESEPR
jgi:transcriptional regulator GlxA family with amidase domain